MFCFTDDNIEIKKECNWLDNKKEKSLCFWYLGPSKQRNII